MKQEFHKIGQIDCDIRLAEISDIPELKFVRSSVKENMLSDPEKITYDDYLQHILNVGRTWVARSEYKIIGFCSVNLENNTVWALFVLPQYGGKGIGKALFQTMLSYFFAQGKSEISLTTDPDTRAAQFYLRQAWKIKGMESKGEILMTLSKDDWNNYIRKPNE